MQSTSNHRGKNDMHYHVPNILYCLFQLLLRSNDQKDLKTVLVHKNITSIKY